MPLFIDVHTIDQAPADPAAEGHSPDLEAQSEHAGEHEPFWIGQKEGKVFWLVEASSAEAAQAAHRRTHGSLASEIYEVERNSPWFSGRAHGAGA